MTFRRLKELVNSNLYVTSFLIEGSVESLKKSLNVKELPINLSC